MVELSGESVIFVRVRPGNLDRLMTDLRRNSKVKEVEPVMGTYDLAVSGAFRSLDELQRFQAEIESKEQCEGCAVHPSFATWEHTHGTEPLPFVGWTLIRTTDQERATKELQRLPSVERLITTTGEFDLIARLSAKDPNDLQEVVIRDIQKVPGVRRTETRAGFRKG